MFIGKHFGPYEILEEVGKGGMAIVFRARQHSVERDVALKVIHRGIAGDHSAVQRFQREARLIARLEHPHILPVHDFDGAHDPPYIVMRYLDSGTLKDVMAQGLLPHEETVYLFRQICSALDYAHRQGIVHRDIKPSNILIDREGNAFVTDLGIARMVGVSGRDRNITETGAIIGTPEYMSPEQAMGEDNIDHRTDLYALGVMLFEIVTGQLPYSASTGMKVLTMHMSEPVPSPLLINPHLPQAIEAIIFKAMAKDREQRYQSAAELSAELSAALGGTIAVSPQWLREAVDTNIIQRSQKTAADTDRNITPLEQNKQLTVLYANLTEFMEMVAEVSPDPQDAREALWHTLDEMILNHGGTIDNHAGDTVLALWGVQSVREDDPERAVRAALAIQQAANEIGKARDLDEDMMPVQIGVHTGMALLKRDESLKTYTASGTAVNMATRLERAAPVGCILISTDTYHYTRGVFLVEGMDSVRLRGSKEPTQVYRVHGAKPRVFRNATYEIEGIQTKLIGRDAEFKQLMEAMETAAEEQQTQIVTIVGEAGMGKSRLLFELEEWEEKLAGDFWYFPARATPPMLNQPFALLRQVFTYRFDVQDFDAIEAVQQKFETGTAAFLGENTQEQAHTLALLFGYTFPNSPYQQNPNPQQLSIQAQKVMADFLTKAAFRRSFQGNQTLGLWLELENIHWADDRSLDFINQLVKDHPAIPMVITCTTRPELYDRRPTWGGGQDEHLRIDLRPLSRRDSRRLVREILQRVNDLPDTLRDLIAERSEGNPFYIEELVRMLIEDRVILKGDSLWTIELSRLEQARIPVTLTGLLQARLDSLLPEERLVLQRASVIGRVFWDRALVALRNADPQTADIPRALTALSARDLIAQREETTFAGNKEYVFTSTLLRDVTYESILKRQQRNYHFEVGNWLVQVTNGLSDYAVTIAEHYEIAGENVQAARYLLQAGEQAQRISAYQEALRFFERGSDLLQGQVDADARRLQANLYHQLGALYLDQGKYSESQKYLNDSIRIARELDAAELLMDALGALGDCLTRQSHFKNAEAVLHESLAMAHACGDDNRAAGALLWLGNINVFTGEFANATEHYEKALKLAQKVGNEPLAARILNTLGETMRYQGKLAEAQPYYEQSRRVYQRLGNLYGLALTALNLGHAARMTGQTEQARSHYHEAMRVSSQINALPITIDTVAGIAGLHILEGEDAQATELLSMVMQHPAYDIDSEQLVQPLLETLCQRMPAEQHTAALERGKQISMDAVVKDLLAGTAHQR